MFAFSNGEDNWTLTLWCLTSGMNDLGSTRLLDLGKPLAMAISGNYHYRGQQLPPVLIVSVNITLRQDSELNKGQTIIGSSVYNKIKTTLPPHKRQKLDKKRRPRMFTLSTIPVNVP